MNQFDNPSKSNLSFSSDWFSKKADIFQKFKSPKNNISFQYFDFKTHKPKWQKQMDGLEGSSVIWQALNLYCVCWSMERSYHNNTRNT